MNVQLKTKALAVFLGDIFFLYLSLFVTLLLRSGGHLSSDILATHLPPFTIIFCFWLLVFYIAGLYDVHRMRNSVDFFSSLFVSIFINVFFAIGFFYAFPSFGIAPKTTLLGFVIAFFLIEAFWRRGFNRFVTHRAIKLPVLILGATKTTFALADFITENPHLGYTLASHITTPLESDHLRQLLLTHQVAVVVIPENLAANTSLAHTLTDAVVRGVEVHSEIVFYEHILRQIPLASVTPAWFFDVAFSSPTLYDQFKRGVELCGAFLLQIIVFPLEILLAILIFITSPGPVFYSQLRMGKHNRVFRLYKFRTMRVDAEKNGAQWSSGANDPRVTAIGKLLRYTHLDELPQLFNVLRGEVAFVGPRPERPEIIENIAPQVPFYHMRHMVTPGITGWAQINFKKDQTIEDVKTKLQYDLYYIEHRSFLFDIAILIRTIRSFFINM